MKKTKDIVCEEKQFLRLCSQEYIDKIQKKENMTKDDFKGLQYVIHSLGLEKYEIYFSLEMFPELFQIVAKEEELEISNSEVQIDKETYWDTRIELYEQYLKSFVEQMPLEIQQKKQYLKKFGI